MDTLKQLEELLEEKEFDLKIAMQEVTELEHEVFNLKIKLQEARDALPKPKNGKCQECATDVNGLLPTP